MVRPWSPPSSERINQPVVLELGEHNNICTLFLSRLLREVAPSPRAPLFSFHPAPSALRSMASQAAKPSVFEAVNRKNLFPTSLSLPISQSGSAIDPVKEGGGLRRRLSSISLRIQPLSYSSSATSWVLRRSKSMSEVGDFAGTCLRNWWEWGWSWVLSRKPTFARDLEMNEEETEMLGCHNRGSWRHIFYKVRFEFRKFVGPGHLPTTNEFRYDSSATHRTLTTGRDAKVKQGGA